MRFKELKDGEVFEFTAANTFRSLCTGPWVRVSTRRYRHVSEQGEKALTHSVGSVNAEVYLVVEEAPKKIHVWPGSIGA